jgi:hypothetical protein
MEITTKQIKVNEFETETRYFAKTDDGFDGTAQGYGYKSIEKLKKAYWFYKNKGKLKTLEKEAKKFLKENPDIKKLLNEYFSADNYICAWKDREELSFDTLLTELKQPPVEIPSEELKEMKMEKNPYQNANEDVIKRLEDIKHLWKSIMHVIGC